jgi:hypothetical protein
MLLAFDGRKPSFRRAYFVQGKAIKAICRELRVSRKVVRKVLRSEATEFRYERDEQPLPRIGPWQDVLDQLLTANETKARRERLTLIRIFEDLRGWGYEGGYDAVRRYARTWQRDRTATSVYAYVPLSFVPAEAYQFVNRLATGTPPEPMPKSHRNESNLPVRWGPGRRISGPLPEQNFSSFARQLAGL